MADAKIELELVTNLENLKSAVSKVPNLSEEQRKKASESFSAANKALEAKDWKTLQVNINKVVEMVSKAIAATGNISEALQKATEIKTKIEKSLNSLRDERTKIENKYVDGNVSKGILTKKAAQDTFNQSSEKGSIVSAKGNELTSREEVVKRYQELEHILQESGKTWQNFTNAMAQQAGFADRNSAFAARRYIQSEATSISRDQKRISEIGSETTQDTEMYQDTQDLEQVKKTIEDLAPVSEEAAQQLQNLYKEIVNIGSNINEGATKARNIERKERAKEEGGGAALNPEDIDNATKSINKQSSSLGKAFKQFTLYAIALRTVKKALHEAARTVKDLDKYLTTQAMVTGKTRKETYDLLKTYQNMASQLGATTKEVAEVATQFLRQGKTAAEALTLAEAAISAAKVAGIGVTESVNYLTTALNGFQLSAEQAMKVSDKFASIAAQSATSYEEIATALSKVAAQANMAGMSIDYTTALLAKGIETTREAPETIGTALKTIIARMRELTDYGATLEDGMNINNVEKQLAYVGIALRTETGELRSTEDVLDELGKKWTELSSNQQAAVAKALAGTRQQSRLIAMMTDYERVTELQEIAQRSAGATAAQAATYMEGMEAALNKVNVAWEKIVTSVTNSEVIIGAINLVSNILDSLGNFLSSTGGMITTMITVGSLALIALGHKMKEYRLAKEQQKVQQKIAVIQAKSNVIAQKQLILEKEQTIEKYKQAAAEARKNEDNVTAQKYEELIEKEQTSLAIEKEKLHVMEGQVAEQEASSNWITSMTSGLSGLITPLIAIVALWRVMALGISKVLHLQKAQEIQQEKNNKKSLLGALFSSADSAAKIPFTGWIIAGVILAAAGVAIGVTLANMAKSSNSVGESFDQSSNQIYKLTEKANGLKQIISDFEAIDNKIIKTNKDMEELNTLLDKAADKLDEQEKADYGKLVSQGARIEYLRKRQQAADDEALRLRNWQLELIRANKYLLTDNSSAGLSAQSALIANNNDAIYRYIDSIGGAAEGVEYFTQSVFENMDALDAYRYSTEEGRKNLEKFVDTINKSSIAIDGEQVSLAKIINSDDYTYRERVDAYNQLYAAIQQLGDPALLSALDKEYSQWKQFNELFAKTNAIDFMEQFGVTIDELNDFSAALQKLGYTAENSASRLNNLFDLISNGANIQDAIGSVFGVSKDDAEYLKILNAYQQAVGTTILDMGQNLQAFKSQINSVYETVTKWSTMSDSEKADFLTQNADLFKSNPELYRAFQTGNYDVIEAALKENSYLQKNLELRKQDLEVQLAIEQAREGTEEYNEQNVAYLTEQLDLLRDIENIFKADLKLRLEQEESQLDIYKDYLQKQQDALTKSLDKRKEAYQKYFDAINQEAEDEDYETEATTLISNLSKLASSTNAGAVSQSKELEKQLQELEKERLETLRQRAQEAVLSNLDKEVKEINEKFDKLLENNQVLLQLMRADLQHPVEFVSDILASELQGRTALSAEDYIKDTFTTAFGSKISPEIMDNISVRENGNNLILNIAGKEIDIGESSQQDLYEIIMKALRQLGLN